MYLCLKNVRDYLPKNHSPQNSVRRHDYSSMKDHNVQETFNSSLKEEFGARGTIRTCALTCSSDCSELRGIARAFQDLRLRNTKFLVVERFQMSHSGRSRMKQMYEKVTVASVVIATTELLCGIGDLTVMLARETFRGFFTCVDTHTCHRTCLQAWTESEETQHQYG